MNEKVKCTFNASESTFNVCFVGFEVGVGRVVFKLNKTLSPCVQSFRKTISL